MKTSRCPKDPNRTARHHHMTPFPELPQSVLFLAHVKNTADDTCVIKLFPFYIQQSFFWLRWVPIWSQNVAISPPLTLFSPLMKSSTLSLRKAAAATMVLPPARRLAATEIHGRNRWRATRGCTTSKHFLWKSPFDLRTETSWRWSTVGSLLCLLSVACCRSNTEPYRCPSGTALIQMREGNLAASHFRETVDFMLFWLLLLRQTRENPGNTHWTQTETQVRLSGPSHSVLHEFYYMEPQQ